MSVQKLVAEADKLLEKGKIPEGIAKLKSALTEEPLNQIVATKLANTLVQNKEIAEAAKVYGALAKRLSDAGKSQVAIAIYKQALELTPDDINLRVKFAQEYESAGKLGDAFLQGQIALQYYLKRKKYFDAANLMPLMARAQPKDEKIKLAWVDVLHLSQAEQKLVHFLVACCGPPGVLSQEFPVGGEPTSMSQALYEGLKKLVPFFPRDPRVAYTMAWAAYRRGRMKEFYHFLRESLRREPDFSLSILLLARVLAETQKMNEALFAYKYFKERMSADKSVDMLTLNRLLETFMEKNGWIKFTEEMGGALDAAGFLKAITGAESASVKAAAAAEKEEKAQENAKGLKAGGGQEHAPAEIEIGLGGDPSGDQAMEIVLATGQTVADANKQQKVSDKDKDPMKMQAELIKAAIQATVAGMGQNQAPQQTMVQPVVLPVIHSAPVNAAQIDPEVLAKAQAAAAASLAPASKPAPAPTPAHQDASDESNDDVNFSGESVEFTSLIKMGADERAALSAPEEVPPVPAPVDAAADDGATRVAPLSPSAEKTSVSVIPAPSPQPVPTPTSAQQGAPEESTDDIDFNGESVEFTSLIKMGADERAALSASEEVPPAPAPADAAADDGATRVAPLSHSAEKTRVAVTPPEEGDSAEEPPPPKKKLFNPMEQMIIPEDMPSLSLEDKGDERTMMFSPIDVLDAAKVMKNRELADVETRSMEIPKEILEENAARKALPKEEESAEADKTKWKNLKIEGEKTVVFSPVEAVQAGVASRRPMDAPVLSGKAEWKKDQAQASPEAKAEAEAGAIQPDSEEPRASSDDDATRIVARPSPTASDSINNLANDGEATRIVMRPSASDMEAPEKSGALLRPEAESSKGQSSSIPVTAEAEVPAKEANLNAIMPIPDMMSDSEGLAGAREEKVDLGDDLLEGATRVFTQPTTADKTEHLIKEIKKEMKQKANAFLNIEMLMKKAERYTAKRNYYLARKALRHAQALGAEEDVVKAKLREIRKLEFPEGLYNTISSDRAGKEDTSEVLDRLEQEFDLAQTDESGSGALSTLVEARIEAIFRESDPRTILDFGVALQEMGLYRQAEAMLLRLVSEFPEYAFDAYYLAAMSKVSRRDFAGAASILKKLSSDSGKTEIEKIQIYYALGEAFEKLRQPDRSRKFFEKVAELDANYRNIRHKLEE